MLLIHMYTNINTYRYCHTREYKISGESADRDVCCERVCKPAVRTTVSQTRYVVIASNGRSLSQLLFSVGHVLYSTRYFSFTIFGICSETGWWAMPFTEEVSFALFHETFGSCVLASDKHTHSHTDKQTHTHARTKTPMY